MEYITFKNSRGLNLSGRFYPAGSDGIIIMCHGLTADKSSLGRFDIVAESFRLSGFNVLNFDFSGCGESDDDVISVKGEEDDLRSVIEFVRNKGYKKIALYGHSFGTLICLKAFSPEVVTMVLSGAVTDNVKYNWNEYYSKEQLEELIQNGFFIFTDRTGRERKISNEILLAFEQINQKEMLESITCPVLIIHPAAENDWEEQQLIKGSTKAMNFLPKGSRLEIVKGESHSLSGYLDQLIEIVGKWYIEKFKG